MDHIETKFDDRDPEIQYSGIWIPRNGTILDYLNTTTFATFAGSSVLFNFSGTSISVYGEIVFLEGNAPATLSNYTIDSGVPSQFLAIPEGEDMHQQLFFSATGLSLGQHTLVITNERNNTMLILDYLQVGSGDGSSYSSTPISSSVTVSATQNVTITALPSSSFTATATITTLHTSSKATTSRVRPPIGVTIGGAVAGSILISFILLACFFARRSRQRKKNLPLSDSLSPPQPDMSHALAGCSSIAPFIIGDPSRLFMGPSLGKGTTRGNAHSVDRDPGNSVPEGVVRLGTQLPSSAGGRGESHSDLPPRYTALSV